MSIDAAFTHFPMLITERFTLRQIVPTDADDFFALFSDPEVMQYHGFAQHQAIDETHAWIERITADFQNRRGIRWGITLHDANRAIGSCSFHRFGEGFHHVETGYDLRRSYWGQGVMREAMTAVLSYGFETLGLHRIEAVIDDANTRSKNVLLKLGFTYEGNLRERFVSAKGFEDSYYYGLLVQEWEGRR